MDGNISFMGRSNYKISYLYKSGVVPEDATIKINLSLTEHDLIGMVYSWAEQNLMAKSPSDDVKSFADLGKH